jgi:hypothetical protein
VGYLVTDVARLEEAVRREHERVRYLLTTEPSEWVPEVIKWLDPPVMLNYPSSCGNCGAPPSKLYWNHTGGWSCRACGASDYEEAAE